MKNNRVLVIGSKGQVASCLKELTGNNWHFVGRPDFDVCNKDHLSYIINELKPELIINTAAYTNVDKAEQEIEYAYLLNSAGVKHLSLECNVYNIPLIHISTDYIFDGKKLLPYTEYDIPNPLSVYGKSKFQGEEHIRQNLQDYIILRTSWVFSHYSYNFVKTIVKLAGSGKPLKIVDDQVGCPTSAINLSKVIIQMSHKILDSTHNTIFGTYNYCDKPQVNWYQFAEKIYEILCQRHNYILPIISRISSQEYNSPATRPQNSALNCSLISRNFSITQYDWLPELEQCIKELI